MDLRKLKTLIDLVSDSNVSELEITEAEGKVRIVKATHAMNHLPASAPVASVIASSPRPTELATPPPGVESHSVKSPMVGTFYRASAPGAKPFVEIGDSIQAGQTVCIIEAMKILNEIESDKSGVVTQILCANGQAVEYGQALFTVE